MARIAGVDIPNNKRVEIALTYIYGIGRKSANDILAKTGTDHARTHAKHVGVVVLSCEVSYLGLPAECSSNNLMLVEVHVDAFSAAADGNDI